MAAEAEVEVSETLRGRYPRCGEEREGERAGGQCHPISTGGAGGHGGARGGSEDDRAQACHGGEGGRGSSQWRGGSASPRSSPEEMEAEDMKELGEAAVELEEGEGVVDPRPPSLALELGRGGGGHRGGSEGAAASRERLPRRRWRHGGGRKEVVGEEADALRRREILAA